MAEVFAAQAVYMAALVYTGTWLIRQPADVPNVSSLAEMSDRLPS